MSKSHAWGLIGLAVALALGAAIRLGPIAQRPLWFDEGDTYQTSAADAGITYDRFFRWNNHFENFPLSFLLTRVAMDVTGRRDPWVLRLPAAAAGILCIAAAYGLGAVAAGPIFGAMMALLAAVDPNMVDQSQQARMYTLLMLFTLIGAAWSIRLLRKPGASKWEWLMPGLMMGLCLWSTPLGTMTWVGLALGVAALLAGGWMAGRPHTEARAVASGFVFTSLIAVLTAQRGVYLMFSRLIAGREGHGTDPSFARIAREVAVAIKDLVEPNHPGMMVVYPLAAAGLWLLARRCKSSAAILGGLAAATLVMAFPFRKQHHFMDPRYLTVAEPALWAGLAMLPMGLTDGRVRQAGAGVRKALPLLGAAAVAAVLGVNLWQSTHLEGYWQQPEKYELAQVILAVKARMGPGDAAIIDPPSTDVLTRYYHYPLDPTLEEAFYTSIPGQRWRPDPVVPESFAAPAAWMVIGNIDDQERFDPADQRYILRPLQAIAKHYGQSIDVATFRQHVHLHRVAAVRFDKDGVKWYGVEDLANSSR